MQSETNEPNRFLRSSKTKDGASLKKTKGWMCYPPDKTKQAVMIHKTPSDARWYANCMSHLKRSGYIE